MAWNGAQSKRGPGAGRDLLRGAGDAALEGEQRRHVDREEHRRGSRVGRRAEGPRLRRRAVRRHARAGGAAPTGRGCRSPAAPDSGARWRSRTRPRRRAGARGGGSRRGASSCRSRTKRLRGFFKSACDPAETCSSRRSARPAGGGRRGGPSAARIAAGRPVAAAGGGRAARGGRGAPDEAPRIASAAAPVQGGSA